MQLIKQHANQAYGSVDVESHIPALNRDKNPDTGRLINRVPQSKEEEKNLFSARKWTSDS